MSLAQRLAPELDLFSGDTSNEKGSICLAVMRQTKKPHFDRSAPGLPHDSFRLTVMHQTKESLFTTP